MCKWKTHNYCIVSDMESGASPIYLSNGGIKRLPQVIKSLKGDTIEVFFGDDYGL